MINIQQNIDITHLSNFKTKAKTKYYFEINDMNDVLKLKEIHDFSKKQNIKTLFIWWWTNILFAFYDFNWIVIKNNLNWFTYDDKSKILESYSNQSIWKIAEELEYKYKQLLWHRFIGLPWSVWWAVFWNAWCFWLEIENNFLEAEVFDFSSWEIKVFSKNESNFSYRNSIFKEIQKYFIIKVKFDLSKLQEKYSSNVDNIKFREEVQPKGNCCGSFFKNPNREFSAGYLIENVWLKWFFYNDAFFSDKHANFLMTSKDNTDYKNLIYLIELARKEVIEKFSIDLIPEVKIIREDIF